jgi:dihydroneopterin aldolase/2-amino-4-hydroxy-6-hydroxymethyldihydropteridine diphosphokinase/dihydropteroate synthase
MQHAHTAHIALGSNLGDRAGYINQALRFLNNTLSLQPANGSNEAGPSESSVRVLDTSFMYESEPMYVLDQARFLNCVCKVGQPSNLPKYDV